MISAPLLHPGNILSLQESNCVYIGSVHFQCWKQELWRGTLVGRSFSVTTLLSDLNWHLPICALQPPIFKQED